jgi:glycogenin
MILLLAKRKHTEADFTLRIKNPSEKLEQLRRSSLLEFEHLKEPVHPEPPLRELPEHSVPNEEGIAIPLSGQHDLDGTTDAKTVEATTTDKPLFNEPNFGGESASTKTENVLSPTAEVEKVLSPTER